MTVRRALPYLAALLLGVCAALLAACAGNTTGGIAAASAADLKRQLEDVRERVDRGRCGELNGQLRQIGDRIDALPASVDEQLKQALRDGVSRLRSTAQTKTQTTAPLETETTPEQTTAAPPTTQTTTGPATTTTPPSTPPTTTPTVTPPPPVEPPPPIGPGGGTPSEIPPP
jgi:TolA-binding protein